MVSYQLAGTQKLDAFMIGELNKKNIPFFIYSQRYQQENICVRQLT